VRKADNLPPSCAVVTKSGKLNFLEPSGPVQAYNGTALPLPLLVAGVTCLRWCKNQAVSQSDAMGYVEVQWHQCDELGPMKKFLVGCVFF